MPRRATALAASVLAALSLVPAANASVHPGAARAADAPISGFTPAHAQWEHEYEQAFSAVPSASTARDLDAYLSREPGLVASTGDWRRVKYVVAKLKSYGLAYEAHLYASLQAATRTLTP